MLRWSESPGQPEKLITVSTPSSPRQPDGVAENGVVRLGDRRVGMERVAMAGEGADLQIAAGDRLLERLARRRVRQQLGRVAVGVAGVAAGADLDGARQPAL